MKKTKPKYKDTRLRVLIAFDITAKVAEDGTYDQEKMDSQVYKCVITEATDKILGYRLGKYVGTKIIYN